MKSIKMTCCAVLFIATTFSMHLTMAQQKNGHVNSGTIFEAMPEVATLRGELEVLRKLKSDEIEQMQKEYQLKYNAAIAKNKTMSEANKESILKELQIMSEDIDLVKKRIDETTQRAQKELADRYSTLFTPINTKFGIAIKSVCKEKGLSYVFDTGNQQNVNNLMYFDEGLDITQAVKTKLGIPNSITK